MNNNVLTEGTKIMFRLLKLLIPALILCAMCSLEARAQTINAASCSQSDVKAALNSVTGSTTVVNIPAGTCHWTTNLAFAVPSANTSLTIQGQTVCTGSGDPAQNNLACTDGTIIEDDDTTDSNTLLVLSANNSNQFLRITGITIQAGSGITKNNGYLNTAAGQNLRVDHIHVNGDPYTINPPPDTPYILVFGCTPGVIDHSVFTAHNAERANAIQAYNGGSCNGNPNGDGSWANPTGFGTTQMLLYVEQNLFDFLHNAGSSSQADDCVSGGRVVFRFNTLYNSAHLQTHWTGHAAQDRGCRATEIYKNQWIFNTDISNPVSTLFFFASGTALVWGNNAQQGYSSFVQLTDCRSPGPTTRCGQNDVGWGFCGSSSAWDGNTNSTGYPCIDQATRGQGDLLTGSFSNNNKMDSLTNTITWPNEKLEPLYFWLNSYNPLCCGNGSLAPVTMNGSIWTQNQDYYVSSDSNSGADCNGFTGATGVGCGARSSRPTTCTKGVAWWSSDQGSWNTSGNGAGNGVLDICTATNIWTPASYTPYTYPHPLDGGLVTPSPAPPTNPQAVVN